MSYIIYTIYFVMVMVMIKLIHKFIRGFKFATPLRLTFFFLPFLIPAFQEGLPIFNIDNKYLLHAILISILSSIVVLLFHIPEIKTYCHPEFYYLLPPLDLKSFFLIEYAIIGSVIFEEIFYRYYIPKDNLIISFILTACLFVFAHFIQDATRKEFSIKSYVSLFVLSIIWYLSLIISDSIIPAMLGHLTYNSPKIYSYAYHLYFSYKNKQNLEI